MPSGSAHQEPSGSARQDRSRRRLLQEDHGTRGSAARGPGRVLGWIEPGLGLALLLLALAARVSVLFHAGALWRDEVTSVNLGSTAPLGTMLGLLHRDSFPALWPLALHAWIALGLGSTDFSLRVLGLLIALVTLAMLCWSARQFGSNVPLIALALFGLSPTVLIYGGEVRGYGLGAAALLLLVGALWRLLGNPTRGPFLMAVAAALLCVHSLFTNSLILFGFCVAGALVALRNHRPRTAALVLGLGLLAAASMLPYLRTFARLSEWNMIVQIPVTLSLILAKFSAALGGGVTTGVWAVLCVLALGSGLVRTLRKDASGPPREKDVALFLLVATAVSLIGFFAYLRFLSLPTQAWYYLPAMAVLALFCDALLHALVRASVPARALRLVLVVALVAVTARGSWEQTRTRMTNVDLLASTLASRCAPDDLVVLNPWYAGVTLERYYRGKAPWVSVPDFEERRFQPYWDFKRTMMASQPLTPVLDRIAATLRSGHRIWLIGGLPFLRKGESPGSLPPAPQGPAGWSEGAYEWVWLRQTAHFVQTRAARLDAVPVAADTPVNHFENLPLFVIEGWRGAEAP